MDKLVSIRLPFWRTKASQAIQQQEGSSKRAVLDELKACGNTKNLQRGKEIHAEAIKRGTHSCNYVATALITMYAKCRSMVEARQVFDDLKQPDVVSWNALILGYAQNGEGVTALEAFAELKSQCAPTSVTFIAAVKACTSLAVSPNGNGRAECLRMGREIHSQIGSQSSMYLQNALIDMYAKSGSMAEAHQVFDSLQQPDLVSWNTLISGYAFNQDGVTALEVLARMSCPPDCTTFIAALKACISLAVERGESGRTDCLMQGRAIHSQIGCHHLTIHVHCTLIDMYAKCGSMVDAREVFESIKTPNVIAWNTLLLGYADNGQGSTALEMFSRVCSPDSVTFLAALKACSSLADQAGSCKTECLERGRAIHSQIGCHLNVYVQTTLIHMYAKCGSMAEARQVFENTRHPNVTSWNALLLGYADSGEGLATLDLFVRMKSQGCAPSSTTFIAVLKACSSLATEWNKTESLQRGMEIHSQIGCHLNIQVQNSLIDMYANCGSMVNARRVFDSMKNPDVVSWTALILGYAENGEGTTSLEVFGRMRFQGCAPNSVTYIAALKACSSLAQDGNDNGKAECLERGKEIHAQIAGCHSSLYLQSTLIDMYAKYGCMVEACEVFDCIEQPDVVSWNALILGYAQNGEGITALEMFARMKSQGYVPDCRTFTAVLKAYGSLGAFESGRRVHAEVDSRQVECSPALVTSLVDFYGRCGHLEEAKRVFDSHPRTRDNLITWNSLLAGYSRLGDDKVALQLFEGIQDAGFRPDAVTFSCILACCSHAGLVEKAKEFFEAMPAKYGVNPDVEHFTCMVDILGRANKLDDAMALLQSMPFAPNAVAWVSVLGACRMWKNVGVARLAFRSLVSLEDTNTASYVLMAHVYGSMGMIEEQKIVLESSGQALHE